MAHVEWWPLVDRLANINTPSSTSTWEALFSLHYDGNNMTKDCVQGISDNIAARRRTQLLSIASFGVLFANDKDLLKISIYFRVLMALFCMHFYSSFVPYYLHIFLLNQVHVHYAWFSVFTLSSITIA